MADRAEPFDDQLVAIARPRDCGIEAVTQDSEKDQAAREVVKLRVTFELALADKRTYPVQEFKAFVNGVRQYIEMTERDPVVHKSVAQSVNGLREFLAVERKRVPGEVLFEADRLECQLFGGYDPNFDGDEPPGL